MVIKAQRMWTPTNRQFFPTLLQARNLQLKDKENLERGFIYYFYIKNMHLCMTKKFYTEDKKGA